MIKRQIEKEIRILLKEFPAVSILGARQIGKTTLATTIANSLKKKIIYFDLERTTDRNKLQDIETVLEKNTGNLMIIDEAQTMPELFTVLRPVIDKHKQKGSYLLLGSVAPNLVKNISETLAGRIAHIELPPINLLEAKQHTISLEKLWFRGGYPSALSAKSDISYYRWMENYCKNFVERDVNLLMNDALSSVTVRKIWNMLAGINGNLLNIADISRSLGVNRVTTEKYLDFLEGAFLIRRLLPWYTNISKRLVKSPKIYFRDSGVLHYFNNVYSFNDLQNDISIGASWESFVVEQIHQLKPYYMTPYFYRTHHGAEADIILVKGNKPIATIEIKLNNSPTVSKGIYEVIDDLKTTHNYIITPNSDTYIINNNYKIKVCSLEYFLKTEIKKL